MAKNNLYTEEQRKELKGIRAVLKEIRDERRELLHEYRHWKRKEYAIKDGVR